MVRLLKLAPATPAFTVKTVYVFAPLMVTRFLSVAPLPAVGPRMDAYDGMLNDPAEPTVMVFCVTLLAALNTVELKLMLAAPEIFAEARASRRLQAASVPEPGVD
jgi:ABC-type spermidine/putrescine transport system permease subunit I